MTYTVSECHAYDNVLVTKYFCTITNFLHAYVRTYSDLSNPYLFNATLRDQFGKKALSKKGVLSERNVLL